MKVVIELDCPEQNNIVNRLTDAIEYVKKRIMESWDDFFNPIKKEA